MPKDADILRTATKPKTLVDTSLEFAASAEVLDQNALLEFLNSPDFLLKLNTAHEYNTLRPMQLRVARILRVLRDSPHSAAKQTLLSLARDGAFARDNWLRQELLVRALVSLRPAPPPAIAFWDSQSTPYSVNRHVTIEILCENGSDPALVLLERKLLDPKQEMDFRIVWIRDPMLRHRNDPPLLRAAGRMLTTTMTDGLQYFLLEALCTYDPDWYPSCSKPKPPPRLLASAEARHLLRQICRFAKEKMDLPARLRLEVEAALAEIGDENEKSFPDQLV